MPATGNINGKELNISSPCVAHLVAWLESHCPVSQTWLENCGLAKLVCPPVERGLA